MTFKLNGFDIALLFVFKAQLRHAVYACKKHMYFQSQLVQTKGKTQRYVLRFDQEFSYSKMKTNSSKS